MPGFFCSSKQCAHFPTQACCATKQHAVCYWLVSPVGFLIFGSAVFMFVLVPGLLVRCRLTQNHVLLPPWQLASTTSTSLPYRWGCGCTYCCLPGMRHVACAVLSINITTSPVWITFVPVTGSTLLGLR